MSSTLFGREGAVYLSVYQSVYRAANRAANRANNWRRVLLKKIYPKYEANDFEMHFWSTYTQNFEKKNFAEFFPEVYEKKQ